MAPKKKTGRPTTGVRGAKMSAYGRLTMRLPPETLEQLAAWSLVAQQPQWQLVAEAVALAVANLPGAVRRRVDTIRRASRPRKTDAADR